MAYDYGKQFEAQFKKNWLSTMANSSIDRIYDSMSGYHGVSNISDFICYKYPYIYYLECKTHKGASIPFDNITQYDDLKSKVGIPGVRAGVILWLYQKDIVMYIPISTITQMKKDKWKSVGLKAIKAGYNIKIIPSTKKIVFMNSDYSCLMDLKDGE